MQNIRNLIRVSMSVVIPRLTKWLFTNSRRDFDYVNNVDTAGGLEVEAMSVKGHSPEERCGYVPTSAKHFAFAMSFVPEPLDAWSFVDIGSGKGRVVMLAIGYPFRRVIGVELAPELHAIAQENLSRFRGPRRCQVVDLLCGDATTVPIPPGDIVVFLYNSFGGALLRRLLDHLEGILATTPRRLILIYSNPVERDAVECRAAFTVLFEGASPYDYIWWGNRRLVVYGAGLVTPGAPSAASAVI